MGGRAVVGVAMRRARVGLILLSAALARASEVGDDGRLHFAPDALATIDFEHPDPLVSRMRIVTPGNGTWTYDPMTPSQLRARIVTGNDSPLGRSYLRWQSANGCGLAFMDAHLFATLVSKRIEVNAWGRADGMEPFVAVTYGGDRDVPDRLNWAWARVPLIRTGRETADGWVEYATGPIDGAVLDRPIHDIILSGRIPSSSDTSLRLIAEAPHPDDAVSLAAIEIRPAAGTPSSGACTAMTMEHDCGAQGECFYGRCVDSAVVWHPVPPVAMQKEIVARVVAWATMFEGDRSVLPRADATWVSGTMALASETATPRTFWGALSRRFEELRDTHTHLGDPFAGIWTPFAPRPSVGSSPLDVCFGPTVKDVDGSGALSYVVWSKGSGAPARAAVGDVVKAIDGMAPKAWVDEVYHRYQCLLPSVPQSDWALSAKHLAWLVSQHAKTLTLERCTLAGVCTTQPDIDVPSVSLETIQNGQYSTGSMTCTPRFKEAVAGAHRDAHGGDNVLAGTIDGGVLAIELDGFRPTVQSTWKAQLDAALTMPHARIVVDAREGHGGLNALGNYLFQQFRGTESPVALVLTGRAGYDAADAPWLFGFDGSACTGSGSLDCSTTFFYVFQPSVTAPLAAASRVAWLNTDDVSNNDMVPRLLQGRSGLSIFAPWPTYGALGSNVPLPPLMPDWSPGSIAMADSRYGTSIAGAERAAGYESGTGVAPDVVVTQTLSDVLNGKDTILSAALTWVLQ
jgi:hypothetical protein